MAARDPLWLMDGATALVDAEEARLGNSAVWETGASAVKVTSGVVPAVATPLRVHQTVTASANLLVEAGQAVIQGTTSATQGGYTATLDAQLTVTYLGTYPADAQPRKDIIIARINDKAYAGSTASFTIEVVKGTASGSPVDPALPASCIPLARINLAASATTVADAVIDDLRSYVSAVGGLTVCTSATRPANVYDGFAVYETDKDRVSIYNGSSWQTVSQGARDTYTPVLTASTTNPTLGSGAIQTGAWSASGCEIKGRAGFYFGSSGAAAGSGVYRISLPTPAKTFGVNVVIGAGWVYDNSANQFFTITASLFDANTAQLNYSGVAGSGSVGAAIPMAFANLDQIHFEFGYEKA